MVRKIVILLITFFLGVGIAFATGFLVSVISYTFDHGKLGYYNLIWAKVGAIAAAVTFVFYMVRKAQGK